jgi:CubicO group peptidase (beta-lactamase class C family)
MVEQWRGGRGAAVRQTILMALAAAGTNVGAQGLNAAQERRIDAVFADYAAARVPGCALSITQAGSVVFRRGYGVASLVHGTALTPNTVVSAAGVAPLFTAAAVAQLAADGALSLDDDIHRYLPELPVLDGPITVRQVLSHTSGWRDYRDLLALDGRDGDAASAEEVWAVLRRQRALSFSPGSSFRESVSNVFLLGQLVARVSGQAAMSYVSTRVLAPLAVAHSVSAADSGSAGLSGLATGYTPTDAGFTPAGSRRDAAGGALFTSVHDLTRVLHQLAARTPRDPAVWRQALLTPGQLRHGTLVAHTLGLHRHQYRGVTLLSQRGVSAGFATAVAVVPEAELGLALACNRDDADAEALLFGVLSQVIPAPPSRPVAVQPGAAQSGYFVSGTTGMALGFFMRADTLMLGDDSDAMPLSAMDDGAYENVAGTVAVAFRDTAVVLTLRDNAGIADTLQRRIPLDTVPPERLREYEGVYTTDELASALRVTAEDGQLVLTQSHGPPRVLAPVWRDAFALDPGATLTFERNRGGRVSAVRVTMRGVHGLRLSRVSGRVASRD